MLTDDVRVTVHGEYASFGVGRHSRPRNLYHLVSEPRRRQGRRLLPRHVGQQLYVNVRPRGRGRTGDIHCPLSGRGPLSGDGRVTGRGLAAVVGNRHDSRHGQSIGVSAVDDRGFSDIKRAQDGAKVLSNNDFTF